MDKKKKITWIAVFILLTVVTLYFVINGSDSFSLGVFISYIKRAHPGWITASFVCMFIYITLEAFSIRYLAAFFGYKKKRRQWLVYSAANLYFSAITPSATGGQPASAVLMIKDGIPASVTMLTLLINITIYTVSIVILGFICLVVKPGVILGLNSFSRLLVILGFLVQISCITVFLLLVYKERILFRIATFFLKILHKLHIVKDIEANKDKLVEMSREYKSCVSSMKGHANVIINVFLLNMCQRLAQIGVTVCVYIGVGGAAGRWLDVIATQGYVILGSNAVPIPGGIGVADYLFLEGFSRLVGDNIVSIELLSRGISFYVCILVCGGILLVNHAAEIYKSNKNAGDNNG